MAKRISELEFKVLIEQDEDGYFVASISESPGGKFRKIGIN